tara:strand:- start:309 stop:644 length:336 start_codon:yes stop_codon:yes gene_type:complete
MSNPAIIVEESAILKVRELLSEEDNEYLKLRVFVTGGGCSGFQYGFTFDEDVAEDDTLIDHKDVKVLVDSLSYQYLVGSHVKFSEGLEGSKFEVQNPSAASTCGCGSSFSI